MKGKNLLLLFLTGFALVSCTGEELTSAPEKLSVTVHLNWGNLLPASGMKYYFYPTGEGVVMTEEGAGDMYQTALPPGNYRVLAHNTGTTGVTFTGMESCATATAEVTPVATTRADGLIFIGQPSALYAGVSSEELVVPRFDAAETSASPGQLTRTLKLTFKLNNMEGVNSIEGRFNGTYSSVVLSTGEITTATKNVAPQVATVFDSPITSNEVTVNVSFLGLLNPAGGTAYHSTLSLTLKGNDGWTQQAEVDLTTAFTDLFAAGGEDFVFEIPTELAIKVEPTLMALSATVEAWMLGEGGGEIEYVYPKNER